MQENYTPLSLSEALIIVTDALEGKDLEWQLVKRAIAIIKKGVEDAKF